MPLSKDTQKPMHAHADEAEVLRVLVAQHLALGQLALARAAARDLARIAGSSHVVNFLRHAARDDLGGPPALASTILRDHETRAWALRTEARALVRSHLVCISEASYSIYFSGRRDEMTLCMLGVRHSVDSHAFSSRLAAMTVVGRQF